MRPRLASWPLWWLSAQSTGRCGSSRLGRRGAACRRGTARSRVPLRHRVALWPLPRLLIFFSKAQKPRSRGAFLFLAWMVTVGVSPVTTTPVAAAPATAAMPAPMSATPAAAPAPVPATPAPVPSTPAAMTAAAPAHFIRRQAICLLVRSNGRLRIRIDGKFGVVGERRRHQRRGLRTRGKRDTARGKSKGEFQKVAALHHISSSIPVFARRRVSSCRNECAMNFAFSFAQTKPDPE
jgi:hypothetical protein